MRALPPLRLPDTLMRSKWHRPGPPGLLHAQQSRFSMPFELMTRSIVTKGKPPVNSKYEHIGQISKCMERNGLLTTPNGLAGPKDPILYTVVDERFPPPEHSPS
jgi:hypothetical protein